MTQHGIALGSDNITKIALDGEGKVEDRFEMFYSRLMDPHTSFRQDIIKICKASRDDIKKE